MAEISVIVPVYNVEKYLDKCVESLIKQTFQDIEILLIDDGSTDSSGAICDKWEIQDARVRAIHKENGGLSDARNRGIQEAVGTYIGFIDSDDYVTPEMYEILYHNLKKEDADVAYCGMYHCYANGIVTRKDTTSYLVVDAKEAVRLMLDSRMISVTIPNRLYKKSLFDQVRFPYGKVSEDVFVAVELMLQTKRAVIDMRPQYYYVHREGSISTKPYTPKDMNAVEGYEKNLKLVQEHYPDLEPYALFRCYWSHFYVLDKMLLAKKNPYAEDQKEVIAYLRKNYKQIIKNPHVGRNRKIAMTGLCFSKQIYKLCLRLMRSRNKRI